MQSEKLSQFFCAAVIISTNRLVLPELLGYPLLRLVLHKITALLCRYFSGISFGCLQLAELQSSDSGLSQDGAAIAPFFLP